MTDISNALEKALAQLNSKRYAIIQMEKEIEEIKKSNLSGEIKGMTIASYSQNIKKLEAEKSIYYLPDTVKKNLVSVIYKEKEKFTLHILKKIIVCYSEIQEYENFIQKYVDTKSNAIEKPYYKLRDGISKSLALLKIYANNTEYSRIESHIYNKIPESPHEILYKLNSDLLIEKIPKKCITKIVQSISSQERTASKPKHFKKEETEDDRILQKALMVGNKIGIFSKK